MLVEQGARFVNVPIELTILAVAARIRS